MKRPVVVTGALAMTSVLASCTGAIGTGSVPHNAVLCAMASAMDAPVQTFGDAQYGGEATVIRG